MLVVRGGSSHVPLHLPTFVCFVWCLFCSPFTPFLLPFLVLPNNFLVRGSAPVTCFTCAT